MFTEEEVSRGLVLLAAVSLPKWDRIRVWVREYAASLDASDADWFTKTQAYLDRVLADEARYPDRFASDPRLRETIER